MRAATIAHALSLVPLQLALFVLVYELPLREALRDAVLLLPVVIVGSMVGLKCGDRLSVALLRRLTDVLLVVLGLMLTLKPLLGS